jgi:hypothetical protein
MDDIQRLVDRLAKELSRGVMLEDRRFRLLAHSAHQEGIDALRSEAILNRETPRAVRQWLQSLGIESAQDWMRIPANPDLGMQPRVCVPVRFDTHLLGHLWIIEGRRMTKEELRSARQAGDAAGVALFRLSMSQQVEQGLEREGLRDLLSDSAQVRAEAAGHLVEADLFRSGVRVCVLVCTRPSKGGGVLDDAARANLDAALHHLRTKVDRRDLLHLVRPDHAVAVLAVDRPRSPQSALPEIAGLLRERLDSTSGAEDGQGFIVALGSVQDALHHSRSSYDEALRAAQIAASFPTLGRLVDWDDLGVYRLLSQLAQTSLDQRILHPGVVSVMHGRHGAERLRLLEVFLDSGGDAVVTAAELGIHRASVYYRLAGLERDMGVSLANGLERLAVHLSVKLIRLAGLDAPAEGEAPVPQAEPADSAERPRGRVAGSPRAGSSRTPSARRR